MSDVINKAYEEDLRKFQEEIIRICLDTVGSDVDTICAYCCTENNTYSFNMFTLVGQDVRTLGQLDLERNVVMGALRTGTHHLLRLDEICEAHNALHPTEMKIVYDIKSSTFSVDCKYTPVLKRKSSADVFDAWVESYRHPKVAKATKPVKNSIVLKKEWGFKQDGLRGPMTSETAALNENTLVYFIKYEKDGFGESQLRAFDLKKQEGKTLFSEKHIIRDIGVSENGRRYFTSFSGKLYCIDDNNGEVLWAVKVGTGNASWEILTDEKNVYMFNQHMYAVDKISGEIVWENPDNLKHSKCTMAINAKYIYRCNSDGFVFCMDKASGEIVWRFGDNLYGGNCILVSENVLFVTAAVKGFGKLYMLNAFTGELISVVDMEMGCTRRPLITGNLIYLGNGLGEVKCYELSEEYTLTEKYSYKFDSSVTTQITLDGDFLWFATEKGYLYCLDKGTGEEQMKKKKVGAVPRWLSIHEGGVLVLSDKGQIEYFSK